MRCLFVVLLLVSSCFADLKYRIQTMGRQVGDTDRIVYVQGQRIRTDALKSRRVSIRECDLNRIVVLDPAKKTYRILPILPKPDVPSSQSSPESGEQVCRGTPRRQVEEVGDGTMLGVPVQHMKIWIYSDPIPDSCTVPNRHSSPPQRSQFRIRFSSQQASQEVRMGRLFTRVAVASLWVLSVSTFCAGQDSSEVSELRTELQQLRAEVSELKLELHQLKARSDGAIISADAHSTPAPPQEQTVTQDELEVLKAQVSEMAQTKVEANSRQPVKLFGTILSTTQFNSGEANWMDIPNLVLAGTPGEATGSFNTNLRQSRIGVIVNGPKIGDFSSTGFAAMDFFGGIAGFETAQVLALPRLLYAYVRLDNGTTALEFGQDQMVLAPNDPTSLASMAFPDLYRSGNLYLRAPQLRVERKLWGDEFRTLRLTAALLAPVGDFTSPQYTFVPPALGGERSRQPAIQGALSWEGKSADSDRHWKLGISGHYNRERELTASVPSWAAAVDFDRDFHRFGFGGEWFAGRDIGKFGGSLGQFGKSWGGFGELRYRATSKLQFNAGYGTDRLYDLAVLPAPLSHNSTVYANTIYRFVPEFATSLEYKWLGTSPVAAALRENNNLNLVFAYSF